jgi:hypothetical protein
MRHLKRGGIGATSLALIGVKVGAGNRSCRPDLAVRLGVERDEGRARDSSIKDRRCL